MNKKMKYMLIIVCILLLTGCTVKSNITLDNNGATIIHYSPETYTPKEEE